MAEPSKKRKRETPPPKNAEDSSLEEQVQISMRLNRNALRDLKRQALDEDLTLKELFIRSLNERRERMGLKKLDL